MRTDVFQYGETDRLMDQKEVASMLGVSVKTLECWRWKKVGPKYIKLGRLARYKVSDVMAFVTGLIQEKVDSQTNKDFTMEIKNNNSLKHLALEYANKVITVAPMVITKVTPVMMLMSVKANIYFGKENIKDIKGYEGQYAITSQGRLCKYSFEKYKVKWLSLSRNTDYIMLGLVKNNKRKFYYLHRIVAEAFIDNPENKPQVNHLNCNKHDNKRHNLEWSTRIENWEHARDHGKYNGTILADVKKHELFQMYCSGKHTYKQLANIFNISISSVGRYISKLKNNI